MLITTTPSVQGRPIIHYYGIVFGEVIVGIDFIKDIAAGLTNIFGGRSGSYEGEMVQARTGAIHEMEQRAAQMGANAIVGVKLDYETLGQGGTMIMVTASGTAVKIQD